MNIDIKEAHRRMLYLLQSFDTVCKKHDIDYCYDDEVNWRRSFY